MGLHNARDNYKEYSTPIFTGGNEDRTEQEQIDPPYTSEIYTNDVPFSAKPTECGRFFLSNCKTRIRMEGRKFR